MNRLEHMLTRCRQNGKKATGLFLTNGFPELEATLPILRTLDEAGADFIELGMPFSDPLAEGSTIQYASERALRNGVSLADCLETVRAFRENSQTPLLLMGYANPILQYGVSNFCRDTESAGVDGLILPDLPLEEASLIEEQAAEHNIALVFLISPNTPDKRIQYADQRSTGFVYAVSMTGLTGSELEHGVTAQQYLERARRLVVNNPLLVGFGIQTPDDAAQLSQHTNGFIVGSELIRRVDSLWEEPQLTETQRLEQIREWVTDLKSVSKTGSRTCPDPLRLAHT